MERSHLISSILPDGRQAVWLRQACEPLITITRPGTNPPQRIDRYQADLQCRLGLQRLQLELANGRPKAIHHTIPCPNPELALNALLDFLDDGPVGTDFADLACTLNVAKASPHARFRCFAGDHWQAKTRRFLAQTDLKVALCILYLDFSKAPFTPMLEQLHQAYFSAGFEGNRLLVFGVPAFRRALPHGTEGCAIFAWS